MKYCIKKSSSIAAAFSVTGIAGYAVTAGIDKKQTATGRQEKKIEWPIADNPDIHLATEIKKLYATAGSGSLSLGEGGG